MNLKIKKEGKLKNGKLSIGQKEKGITLIALVITIIVLLILAAVSIATLSGENGILNMASRASRETNKSTAKERIELEVMGSISDGMSLDVGKLNENLKKNIPELKHGGKSLDDNPIEKLPTIVELDGFTFEIDEDGNVTILEGITLSKKSVELQIITNGTEKNAEEETITATLTSISGPITWKTEGKDTIDLEQSDDGKSVTITAKNAGNETIKATCSGETAECEVTVKNVTAVNSIKLEPTEKTIDEGGEFTIKATTEGGDEKIKWKKTEGNAEIIITPIGEGNKECKIVAQKEGTAKVEATAACGAKAECKITVKSPYIDNSYVQYDVEYKDVYTGTQYTKNTGWRLLTDLSKNEKEGTYEGDIDIISTGIPAKLYYYYSTVKSASWAEKDQNKRQEFLDKNSYQSRKESDYNIHAAVGLLNNFKEIIFNHKGDDLSTSTLTENKGGYREIKTNGIQVEVNESEEKKAGDLFTANIVRGNITGIRSVHLGDIKGTNDENTSTDTITNTDDKKPGLFKLNDYKPDVHNSGLYWLASPIPYYSYDLRYVLYNGNITSSFSSTSGVRPVVSISGVKLKLNGHVWEFVK